MGDIIIPPIIVAVDPCRSPNVQIIEELINKKKKLVFNLEFSLILSSVYPGLSSSLKSFDIDIPNTS